MRVVPGVVLREGDVVKRGGAVARVRVSASCVYVCVCVGTVGAAGADYWKAVPAHRGGFCIRGYAESGSGKRECEHRQARVCSFTKHI